MAYEQLVVDAPFSRTIGGIWRYIRPVDQRFPVGRQMKPAYPAFDREDHIWLSTIDRRGPDL